MKLRHFWIDYVKLTACILVAVGHLLQSFIKSGIIPQSNALLLFDRSIYTFHVPLFFICSGFLYQKYSRINSLKSYFRHARKKFCTLGVPYLFFVTITWVMKRIMSSEVNKSVGGFFDAVFVHPIMQYWYLYCLLLLFLIIPTAKSKRTSIVFLVVSVCMKMISFRYPFEIYALYIVFSNAVWFVLGMCLCSFDICRLFKNKSTFAGAIVLILAFLLCCTNTHIEWNNGIDFVSGLLACAGIILFFGYYCEHNTKHDWIQSVSKYTMPIYLMHTMFAAAGRIFLLKLGIDNPSVHIASGLVLSFGAPVFAANIMLRTKVLSQLLGVYRN